MVALCHINQNKPNHVFHAILSSENAQKWSKIHKLFILIISNFGLKKPKKNKKSSVQALMCNIFRFHENRYIRQKMTVI